MFGRGSGPIFLANVRCGGLEARLFDCTRGQLEENDCGHNEDAGVICLEGKNNHIKINLEMHVQLMLYQTFQVLT